MSNSYGNVVGDQGKLINDANLSEFVLTQAENDVSFYKRKMIVGADFTHDNLSDHGGPQDITIAKAFYNSVPIHSLPLSVNLLSNALLKVKINRVHKHCYMISLKFCFVKMKHSPMTVGILFHNKKWDW